MTTPWDDGLSACDPDLWRDYGRWEAWMEDRIHALSPGDGQTLWERLKYDDLLALYCICDGLAAGSVDAPAIVEALK